jgi:Ulp1 family protease
LNYENRAAAQGPAAKKLCILFKTETDHISPVFTEMPAEDKILSYFDVVLRQGDVDLLKDHSWLNDNLIAFYFEYLAREKFKDISDILLIPGAATYLLTSAGACIS